MNYIYFSLFCLLSLNGLTQNLEWAKSIGSNGGDYYRKVFITQNNDIVSSGRYGGVIDLDPGTASSVHSNSGGQDGFVQRLDPDGNYIWSRSWANGISGIYITDIAEDKYGNLYFTGNYSGTLDFDPGIGVYNLTSLGFIDYFILKLNSEGNFLWAKSMGGIGNDEGSSIYVDENLNIYTAGLFNYTVDFDPNMGVSNLTSDAYADAFIQKLDSTGNLVWVHGYGGWDHDEASLISDGKDGLYVFGVFSGNVDFNFSLGIDTINGNVDAYILKIDTNASFKWVKYFDGPTTREIITDMGIDKNGNIYMTGLLGNHSGPGGAIVDFDPSNAVVNGINSGEEDIFEVSLDSEGNFRWLNKIGNAYNDRASEVALDDFGNVFFVGTYEASVDFDTGLGADILNSSIGTRLYLHAVDTNGLHKWVLNYGERWGSTGYIAIDNSNKLVLNGSFRQIADFDPNSGSFILPYQGGFADGYILKFNSSPVGIEQKKHSNYVNIFPNPVLDVIYIKSEKEIQLIEIIDLTGRKVFVELSSNNKIRVSDLSPGVYILKATFKEEVSTHKFIKQ